MGEVNGNYKSFLLGELCPGRIFSWHQTATVITYCLSMQFIEVSKSSGILLPKKEMLYCEFVIRSSFTLFSPAFTEVFFSFVSVQVLLRHHPRREEYPMRLFSKCLCFYQNIVSDISCCASPTLSENSARYDVILYASS